MFCSGAAALGYQVVWSRMFATGLGHETPSMLAIVCAFMFGMALGSWLLDRKLDAAKNPARWYGLLELVIGSWAFVAATLIPSVNEMALKLIGVSASPVKHWLVAFALPTLALLPATAAMGATFPAMERFIASLILKRSVAVVYAMNTFGAVAGIFLSVFVIAPAIGFTVSVLLLGCINIACGVVAILISRRKTTPTIAEERPHRAAQATELSSSRLLITLFATGLLGIGIEVAGTRVLSQILENTIYTFAAVLSIYLLGTATGAGIYFRVGSRFEPRTLLSGLLAATTFASVLGVSAVSQAQTIYGFVRKLGDGPAAVLAAELLVAASVFLAPTIFMGATFSHVAQLLRARGMGVGRAAALNTLGGAIATLTFGVALLPLLGSKWTLLAAAFGYAALAPRMRKVSTGLIGLSVLLTLTLPRNLHVISIPPGGKLIAFDEGVMAAVAVVEDARGDRVLRVNNRFQMGGTAAADAEYRQAHIPLLLHPQPHRALFLGIGTGITLGGAALHTNMVVDGVELVPEVVSAMPLFEPLNRSPQQRTNFSIHVADARRFVRSSTNLYDVIVADLFHPARDGAGTLYTIEHFDAIRQRLAPDGLFCQWLPLHQLDEEMLAVIARSFASVFPDTRVFLLRYNVDAPVVGLVGTFSRFDYRADWLERRAINPDLRAELKRLALADSLRLLGHFVGDDTTITALSPREVFNTDDVPLVTFRAPRFVYDQNAKPYGRLMKLLESSQPSSVTLTKAPEFQRQLDAYAAARNEYLRGLVEDFEGNRDGAVSRYLSSARLSDDFTTGYAQCLSIASLLARSEPQKAREILQKLIEAQPTRPVAAEMLRRLNL